MAMDHEKQLPENAENTENTAQAESQGGEEQIKIVKVGVRPGFMLRKVGQAYMVMPTGPRMKEYEGMITLNETGAFLFKEAQKPDPTRTSLVEACIREYGATNEEAEQAADMFIMQCAQCGIFETATLTKKPRAEGEGTNDEPV